MPSDRDQILRRRALLIGSAMTAFGCGPAAQPATPPAVIAAPADTESETEDDDAVVPDDLQRRGDATRPSSDVPDGVSADLKNAYEWHFANTRIAEQHAANIRAQLPSCTIGQPDCDRKWRAIAREYYSLKQMARRAQRGEGPGYNDATLKARVAEHNKYVVRVAAEVDTALAQAIDVNGAYWLDLVDQIRAAASMPCLSPLPP